MTKEELAKELDGREIGNEVSIELSVEAEKSGLVIVFGASDDLIELEGAIEDEFDAYGGGKIYFKDGRLQKNECDYDECPYFKERLASSRVVEAVWNGDDNGAPAWTYKTDIPHSEFNILEDDGVYCRGIVFSLSDV